MQKSFCSATFEAEKAIKIAPKPLELAIDLVAEIIRLLEIEAFYSGPTLLWKRSLTSPDGDGDDQTFLSGDRNNKFGLS